MKLGDFWVRDQETKDGDYLIAIPFTDVTVIDGKMHVVFEEPETLSLIVQLVTLLQQRYPEKELALNRLMGIWDDMQGDS